MSHGSPWLQPIKSTCGGGNCRAVQVQSKLTTRKVGPFYTGERKGSRSKKAEVVWIIPLAHGGLTVKLCSLDVRSGGQSRPPPWSGGGKVKLGERAP